MNFDPGHVFGPRGPLSKQLRYFEYRPAQVEYANKVRQAFTEGHVSLLEAQTGTGKTLAYLIPALESGRRVIVSTGTKALQEQLYFKDIPFLQQRLRLPFRYTLLKGRSNYLCLLKYERVQREPMLPDHESVGYFEEIQRWASQTTSGDIAESEIPERAAVWKELTISAEACHGSRCRFYQDCFVFKRKQEAEESQILIVNHHLFFADLSLQIQSDVSIFPTYDSVVFDEAHHIAEVATHNLSVVFSQRKFRELHYELIRELQILRHKEGQNVDQAEARARKLGETIETVFQRFIHEPQKSRYDRNKMSHILESSEFIVNEQFTGLLQALEPSLEKTEDMPQIYRRIATDQSSLGFLFQADDDHYVFWAERNDTREWTLQGSPLDVSEVLAESLWPRLNTAVLTSATLFLDQDTGKIKQELGLETSRDYKLPYNYDYQSQACLYVPKHLPSPSTAGFADAAAGEIARLVQLTNGSALVLCTSYANMKTYRQALEELDYTLLVQGTKSKQILLDRFQRQKGCVLLATMSFWQGIDLPGDTLISVIVDKLPFASPNDPMTEAKIEYLKKQNRDPFHEYQLPSAVMMLKQGLGRLIRTNVDYGILAVLDHRLLTKSYGRVFLRNLPAMPILHKLDTLREAFEERRNRFAAFH